VGRLFTLKPILAAALLVRLPAIRIGLNQARLRGALYFDEYGGIAMNILQGRGFSYGFFGPVRPTSIHPPAYPHILASLFRAFGTGISGIIAAILMNTILSVLLLYIVYRSAKHLFGPLCGLITLCMLAFYPSQIYYAASGLPTGLYETVLFLVLLLAWRLKESPSTRNGIIWGLCLGACALSYSFVLILSPFLAVWVILSSGRTRFSKATLSVVLAAIVAIAICTPWTIRNYRVHKRWIPIRNQAGTNLWWGNGPYATGGPVDSRGSHLGHLPDDIMQELRSIPNEVDADRYLRDLAIEHMRQNPGKTLRLWLVKLRSFWWFGAGPVAGGLGSGPALAILKALKAILLILAAAGFVLLFKRHTSLAALGIIVCVVTSAIFMVFHSGRLRYFVPLEPILIMAAAYAATYFITGPRRKAAVQPRRSKW
jgi:4-amino-4-deoxy-L-arabinose transferase-like glycosyltransferase